VEDFSHNGGGRSIVHLRFCEFEHGRIPAHAPINMI